MKMAQTVVALLAAGIMASAGFAFGVLAQSSSQSSTSAASTAAAPGIASDLPKDVYPDSRFRLPLVKREDLDEQAKKMYDRSAGPISSNNLVGLQGPTGIRLYSPTVGEMSRDYNDYLRFNAGLKGNVRELAILVTAREMDNQFEWAAHEPEGREQGLSEATIDAIKNRKSLAGLPAQDAVIIQLGREVFGHHKVSSPTFARALMVYGPRDLVTIVALMGHYSETGILLETFDMQLPPGEKPLLPVR
jgi:4-carboxymuconolactone decarboxylase